jgi:hypothetical protein
LKRRRNLTSSGKRKRKNDSCRSFNAFKKSKQGKSGRRN